MTAADEVVTTTMFTDAERAAWRIAVRRGLALTAADLRYMLEAAAPLITAPGRETCPLCGRGLECRGCYCHEDPEDKSYKAGAAAERERIIELASQLRAAIPADHPAGAQASFADYLRVTAR